LLIFVFVRCYGYDFLHAGAAARVVNVATNAAALSYFASHGLVLWQVGAGMAVCNIVGATIGALDVRAYQLIRAGRPEDALLYFLPCVALIQPNGSLVELMGGAAAALVAAFGWRALWRYMSRRRAPVERAEGLPSL